jgi:hypothetical protein
MSVRPAVIAAAADPDFIASLPGCDFADAFSMTIPGTGADAREVAALCFSRLPDWAGWLLALRNAVMRPFGIKTDEMMQSLPVLREDAGEVVVGLNDDHLDFRTQFRVDRICLSPDGPGLSLITLTTIVRTHNRLGRIYLAIIMPVHKLVVRSLLKRVAARLAESATS